MAGMLDLLCVVEGSVRSRQGQFSTCLALTEWCNCVLRYLVLKNQELKTHHIPYPKILLGLKSQQCFRTCRILLGCKLGTQIKSIYTHFFWTCSLCQSKALTPCGVAQWGMSLLSTYQA
jgi:hypothetical protein